MLRVIQDIVYFYTRHMVLFIHDEALNLSIVGYLGAIGYGGFNESQCQPFRKDAFAIIENGGSGESFRTNLWFFFYDLFSGNRPVNGDSLTGIPGKIFIINETP